jgi:hypothetical protein
MIQGNSRGVLRVRSPLFRTAKRGAEGISRYWVCKKPPKARIWTSIASARAADDRADRGSSSANPRCRAGDTQCCLITAAATFAALVSQGACGCAAPGSREPRRYASRPFGFVRSREDFMSPSPGAVGPGSRRRRRRYADPPAAALLTGLGAALGPGAAFGVAMLTRPGCLVFSE